MKKKLGISDFEMEDIKQQAKYREKALNKIDSKNQIKQDTYTRMILMFTKLGVSKNDISSALKISPEQVNESIKLGIESGLIKQNQINGIDILKLQKIKEFEEIER